MGRGDVGAFEVVFTATWAPIRARAVAVLRDTALAEEVAQEVLLEVWVTAARFDPRRGTAWGWLMTMTQRRAIDRVRAEQARRRREHLTRAEQSSPDVAELVCDRAHHQAVRASLERLTALQRQAITLAFYGGLTYVDVAAVLEVPVGTVKARIRDGLQRLARMPGAADLDHRIQR